MWFQSPILRGSGCWSGGLPDLSDTPGIGFNPLFCGALVAGGAVDDNPIDLQPEFQSPILRGSGCWLGFDMPCTPLGFQSPILRGSGCWFFRTSNLPPSPKTSFNPLFCGALVAGAEVLDRGRAPTVVSIPYSAGLWLLDEDGAHCT